MIPSSLMVLFSLRVVCYGVVGVILLASSQGGGNACLPIRVDLCEYDLSAVVSMIAPPFDYY